MAVNLAKSLIKHQFYFEEPVKRMKFMGIHAKNRIEWLVTDWACTLGGLTSIPLYDTLGK
jgi:long-subunit acyl-CoA synthetase (AMP-forming)